MSSCAPAAAQQQWMQAHSMIDNFEKVVQKQRQSMLLVQSMLLGESGSAGSTRNNDIKRLLD